jgi:hypothetical protein
MTAKIETSKEKLQYLTYLVKNFQAAWKANKNNLNDIPYDGWPCVGLAFFTEALKVINQLEKNQPD